MSKPAPHDIPRDDLPGEPFDDEASTTLTDEDRAFGAAAQPRAAQDEDHCYWEKLWGPLCIANKQHERWCYVCCSGGVCETVYCETRIVGNC